MKLKIIYDNNTADRRLNSGWGLSCLLDDNILFDTGDNGSALLDNFQILDINPLAVQKIFISHDHWDHWGGLWDFIEKYRHPEVHYSNGFSEEFKQRISGYKVKTVVRNDIYELAPDIIVSRDFRFTYKSVKMTERVLICLGEKAVILSGCAHPGILTIADQLQTEFPDLDIGGIAGGFHLESASNEEVYEFFKTAAGRFSYRFIPLHCSGNSIRGLCGCTESAGSEISI